ncbi:MAG: hypothetical protein PHN75_01485 [Syntrophales bacterium]|nr:hypothetical protein [Syntrophales bacterium]
MNDDLDANMIEDIITIHDQFQFEIKWAYKINNGNKFTNYEIETYFFIPQNLGINKTTYKKNDFFNDLKTYIRFKTPTMLLRNIADGPGNLLQQLNRLFMIVSDHPDKQQLIEYENKIKLFCCEFKSALRDHVTFIEKKEKQPDIVNLIDQYIECVGRISRMYRELRNILNVPTLNEKVFTKYLFGDEYISIIIEDYSYALLSSLSRNLDFQNSSYLARLLEIINREIEYRRHNYLSSVPQADSDNEVVVFRKSILKKYIGSILFLKVHTENDGRFLEQLLFGTAAGLAMIFATIVAFISQKAYGSFSLPVFFALVISYMFKDRIKELLRTYFSEKLDAVLFDHKTYLQMDNKEKVGWCKESFNFINEVAISDKIRVLRNRDHITEIENDWMGEQIILYKKLIRLYANDFSKLQSIGPVDSINDIMRFNIEKLLTKMDNPLKPIFITQGDGYKKIYAKRVYHVNLVTKYSIDGKSVFKRFRIILNRKGIKAIEMTGTE